SVWRYRYHDFVTERFAHCYGDMIGEWCEKHNIAYTGHFLSERTLYSQTLALGETMRQYRAQQLPGVDILANQYELTTVKQAESVRRQMNREGLVCELYGVLEWDVSLLEHKLQGDWLAALGVTTRVHHLTFMSMGGESKRDWPASIGYQSPWWKYYAPLETYFARVNALLTRGKAVSRVAVLHPIESFWLLFGPNSQTLDRRQLMDEQFENLAQWLLYGLIDYDYVSEALMPGLVSVSGSELCVGHARYEAVVVPEILTVRQSTLDILERFADAGGKVVVLGSAPEYVDGLPSNVAKSLWDKAESVRCDRVHLLKALEDCRDVDIRMLSNGKRADNLIYNLRNDGSERTLFISHVRDEKTSAPQLCEVTLKGLWRVCELDAMSGEVRELGGTQDGAHTRIVWRAHCHDSLLLRLAPGAIAAPEALKSVPENRITLCSNPQAFQLHEPNALLLDRARFAIDDESLSEEKCDILKLDNALRLKAGLPARNGNQVQPWLTPAEPAKHTAHLLYTFNSVKAFNGLKLAIEQPENAAITLNGVPVSNKPVGWYVDEDIKTLELPRVETGANVLELTVPLTKRTNLESLYILGNFGVDMAGDMTLTDMPEAIFTGDLTRQSLPFYTGNISYYYDFTLREDACPTLKLRHALTPVACVKLDGKELGVVFTEPWQLALGQVKKGTHRIEIVLCGTRFNGFGTLHNANPDYKWYGPDAYRTQGDEWTDAYLVRPWGLMDEPDLFV
ncbi:MAG: hypothetical protein II920_02435, partial [Clostridia bacterium]|nr:hypothetical protein [Clostridia bacterium]